MKKILKRKKLRRLMPVVILIIGILLLLYPTMMPYIYMHRAEGGYGRIVIKNGWRLYTAALYEEGDAQRIVDKPDSAWINRAHTIIGDHNMQGLRIIEELEPGHEMVIIKNGEEVRYRLTEEFEGINTGKGLTDMRDNHVEIHEGDIITYTCKTIKGVKVTIAVWTKDENQEQKSPA